MRRSLPLLSALVASAMLVFAAGASAKAPAQTCTASSPNVVGHKVTGTLTSSNVDPSQARFATCARPSR